MEGQPQTTTKTDIRALLIVIGACVAFIVGIVLMFRSPINHGSDEPADTTTAEQSN